MYRAPLKVMRTSGVAQVSFMDETLGIRDLLCGYISSLEGLFISKMLI